MPTKTELLEKIKIQQAVIWEKTLTIKELEAVVKLQHAMLVKKWEIK